MRHILNGALLILIAFVLSIGQHFITGLYGREVFPFILLAIVIGYIDYQISVKVFEK